MIQIDSYFSNGLKPPTSYGLCGIGYTNWKEVKLLPTLEATGLFPKNWHVTWRFLLKILGGGQTKGGKHVATDRFPTVMVLCKILCGSMYTLKRHFFFGGKMIIYLSFDEFQIMGVLKKTTP